MRRRFAAVLHRIAFHRGLTGGGGGGGGGGRGLEGVSIKKQRSRCLLELSKIVFLSPNEYFVVCFFCFEFERINKCYKRIPDHIPTFEFILCRVLPTK